LEVLTIEVDSRFCYVTGDISTGLFVGHFVASDLNHKKFCLISGHKATQFLFFKTIK